MTFRLGFAAWLCRKSIICSCVSNGPWTRPFLRSSNPWTITRSTRDLGVRVILQRSAFASKQVPHIHTELISNTLGNDHLIFVLDSDNRHKYFNQLNSSTVQLVTIEV